MQKDEIHKLQITNGIKYHHKKIKCDKLQSNKIQTEKNTNKKIQNDPKCKSGKIQAWQNAKLLIVTVVFL